MFKKILVVSPSSLITGGPEALHHLVHEMRILGLPAYICYYPFNERHEIPEPYKGYQVDQTEFIDDSDNLIIFPETYTEQLSRVKFSKVAIWWLSLDNFLVKNQRKNDNFFREKLRYLRLSLKGSRPLLGVRGLKKAIHFSQSQYVASYLSKRGIKSNLLFEPINSKFLIPPDEGIDSPRENIILYNPAKGLKITNKLIASFPNFRFLPLKGFTREQLAEKMKSAKIYIDFGNHPGRDRMPREAAMLGACVIVSRKGSAAYSSDVPLPQKFKLDTQSDSFHRVFEALVIETFNSFDQINDELSGYRKHLISEPEIFVNHIKHSFLNK